jgi:hypothetical protein
VCCAGFFNIGSVVGLALMPVLSSVFAWPDAFAVFGVLGISLGMTCLAQIRKHAGELQQAGSDSACASEAQAKKISERQAGESQEGIGETKQVQRAGLQWEEIGEYAALIWAHSVIGWGFFMFQNWLPTYLQFMNVNDPLVRGILSALPWIAPACLSFVFRSAFEMLRQRGVKAYKSQTIAHTIACLGAAAALIPIATANAVAPLVGLASIGSALALQTANYSGFHSYVQHCFESRAGSLLGITNSCGIVVGMAANLAMGWTITAYGSYKPMFAATALIYASSWVAWILLLRGKKRYS